VHSYTPLKIIQKTGVYAKSSQNNLEVNLKQNLHTFDGREDISAHMKSSFTTGLFPELSEAFNELSQANDERSAKELVTRHAVLHPLPLGSCMREVAAWGCPYRMKCQGFEKCEHFTLTDRIDEPVKIAHATEKLNNRLLEVKKLNESNTSYSTAVVKLESSLEWLESLNGSIKQRMQLKKLAPIPCGIDHSRQGEVKTLTELFALEHMLLEEDA
jgi:hypothetical protein